MVGAVASAYGSSEGGANASVGTGISQNASAAVRIWHGGRQRFADQRRLDLGRRERIASAGGPGLFGVPVPGNATAVAHVGTGIYQDASRQRLRALPRK